MLGGKGKNGLSILTVKSAGLISSVTSVAPATVKFNADSASAIARALIVFCCFISVSPLVDLGGCGSGRDEEPSGGEVLRLIQARLATLSMPKISLTCQENWPRLGIADSVLQGQSAFDPHARQRLSVVPMCVGQAALILTFQEQNRAGRINRAFVLVSTQ